MSKPNLKKCMLWALAAVFISTAAQAQVFPYRKGVMWGFADANGKVVKEPIYESVYLESNGNYQITQNYYSGLIDSKGNQIAPPIYSYFTSQSDGLIVFSDENYRYGAMDATGNVVVKPIFESLDNFRDGTSLGTIDGKMVIVNKDGTYSKPIKGEYNVGWFSDYYNTDYSAGGFKVVSDNAYNYYLLSAKGKVMKGAYYSIAPPKAGLFVVYNSSYKYGAVDAKGKLVLKMDYDYLEVGENNIITCQKDGVYSFINNKGKTVIPGTFYSATAFDKNGFAIVSGEDYYYNLIDASGNKVGQSYTSVYAVGDYYIAANSDYMSAILDKTGNPISPFSLVSPTSIGGKYFNVYDDESGKYGLVDATGKVIIEPQYDYIGDYGYEGYYGTNNSRSLTAVAVKQNEMWALFDLSGKNLTGFKYYAMYATAADNIFEVTCQSGRNGYINNRGVEFWEETAPETIEVGSEEELFNALGSDRIIVMKPGVYVLNNLGEEFRYGENGASWSNGYDDNIYSLSLSGIVNLTIKAKTPGTVEIINNNILANVFYVSSCYNVVFEGLKIGHGEDAGSCEGNVIESSYNYNLKILNCDLYGSGAIGLRANGDKFVEVKNTTIRECTYGAVDMEYCNTVSFDNCIIKDNKGFNQFRMYYCDGKQSVSNTTFANNNAESNEYGKYNLIEVTSYMYGSTPKMEFANCTFENNSCGYFHNGLSNFDLTNPVMRNNTWIDGEISPEPEYNDYGW